ncbi:magnesium-translocating P-type ATPase [Mycoplasmopsis hyopharyngis]|uniref:magnesium-translocating P-type ATPase n=1 Tax=Mycoplasmopsis hyopharyngis TaxID=29558 RepID=UPI0038737187
MKKTIINTNEITNRLINASNSSNEELFSLYESSIDGITSEEIVEKNQEKYGKNKLSKKSKNNVFRRLINSFFNPFSIILIVLALVSFTLDVIWPLATKRYKDVEPMTVIIIMSMVIISGIIHFVQETKSNSSAEKLVKMIETTTRVRRNGIAYEIPLQDVVVGDIVELAAGDIIPADVKILSAKDLFVSQSSLTGESDAIEKYSFLNKNANFENITDRNNLAFMGSNIISGSANAMVISTGNSTFIGQIANKINEKPIKTDFEKGISSISWLLIKLMCIMVPMVLLILIVKPFILGTEKKYIDAIFFAISIAIGLTPEMLPMIITSTLAKGAISMSKKQTIVKNINSIQNFGAMNIFCTDKTGTLTLDKVVLEKHLNIYGNEDSRVLKYAFLNSWFQTGLKNLLDKSIIEKTEELSDVAKDLRNLDKVYEKIDEIPFDFERKRMSVLVRGQSKKIQMITKGAVEEILSICDRIELKEGVVEKINSEYINQVLQKVDQLNDQGMRVIAVARKSNPAGEGKFSTKDEKEMILIGYLAFLDPPKESTKKAIENLHTLGVEVKILTGDNARVTKAICRQVGIDADNILLGKDIAELSDEQLQELVKETHIFAKLSPDQKSRIITILRKQNNVVGYMGDGINDAPAMKVADVSISVDTAVDIAKESANIILLEKDLSVLATGIVEGRKTYSNMNKYVKMTASSNLGNIFSMLIATLILPFIPLLAVQILIMNLIYDFTCGSIPWDNVDKEHILKPKKWNPKSVRTFMFWFAPVSSIVDILAFIILRYVMIPNVLPGISANTEEFQKMFWTGWLVISMWTQSLVIHFIRTQKIPFIKSIASWPVIVFSFVGIAIINTIPYIPYLNSFLKLTPLPPIFYLWLLLFLGIYIGLISLIKFLYIKKYKELL